MDHYRKLAGLLRLVAHPARLQILDALGRDRECVCHLSTVVGKSQPYVSQQLATLRNAGLIMDEKDGLNVYYRLADDEVRQQVVAILESLSSTVRQPGQGHQLVAGCPCPKCRRQG